MESCKVYIKYKNLCYYICIVFYSDFGFASDIVDVYFYIDIDFFLSVYCNDILYRTVVGYIFYSIVNRVAHYIQDTYI